MVGVPGRSKACKTCKRRRKGCDARRPACGRCIRGGFECGGYDDATHIVLYQTDKPDAQSNRRQTGPRQAPLVTLGVLPPSLRNAALRSAYLGAAWGSLHPIDGGAFSHAWLPDFPAAYDGQTALHSALTAVSLARAGQQNGSKALFQQSLSAYQKAVVGIQKRLFLPHAVPTEETIACVLLLAVYETVQGSSEDRMVLAIAHTTGARGMMRSHGPAILASPIGRGILRDLRQHAFLEALGSRQPSFLARPPWSEMLQIRSPKENLLNVISEIPLTMRRYDRLKARGDIDIAVKDLDSIHYELQSLIRRLGHWYATEMPTNTFWYTPSSKLCTKCPSPPSPQRRQYACMEFAELEMVYTTAQLITHFEVLDLSNTVSAMDKAETVRIDSTHAFQQAQKYIDVVLESLEYFLSKEAGVLAASSTVLPTIVSLAFLQKMGDGRVEYVLRLLRQYQESTAVPLADLTMEGLSKGVRDEGEAVRWKEMAVMKEGEEETW